MKPSLVSCWYPFQLPEVKAIYENLTRAEASRLKEFAWKEGSKFGLAFSVLAFLFAVPLQMFSNALHSYPQPWGFVVFFCQAIAVGLLIGWGGGSTLRYKARRILCESAYSKEMGYTPDRLRLYAFEWPKD